MRIGITSGCEYGTVVEGWPLIYVNKGVVERLEQAGATPIVLPVLDNADLIERYMELLDGIVISGEVSSIKKNVFADNGENVLQNSHPQRYANETAAVKAALKHNIPLLGICRGYQVLNVAEGGLMKEEDVHDGNHIIHQQGGRFPPEQGVHDIIVAEGTRLHAMLKRSRVCVNSFHRQAVAQVPPGYIASAVAEDGRIEAVEAADDRPVVGVQFHPEMMAGELWRDFFPSFLQMVKRHKR